MLMTKDRRPTIRTMRGWAIYVLQEAGAIRDARSTAGCRTAPIRMRGSEPSISPVKTRQQASPLTQQWPRFATCWTRSATPARNAPLTSGTGASIGANLALSSAA